MDFIWIFLVSYFFRLLWKIYFLFTFFLSYSIHIHFVLHLESHNTKLKRELNILSSIVKVWINSYFLFTLWMHAKVPCFFYHQVFVSNAYFFFRQRYPEHLSFLFAAACLPPVSRGCRTTKEWEGLPVADITPRKAKVLFVRRLLELENRYFIATESRYLQKEGEFGTSPT